MCTSQPSRVRARSAVARIIAYKSAFRRGLPHYVQAMATRVKPAAVPESDPPNGAPRKNFESFKGVGALHRVHYGEWRRRHSRASKTMSDPAGAVSARITRCCREHRTHRPAKMIRTETAGMTSVCTASVSRGAALKVGDVAAQGFLPVRPSLGAPGPSQDPTMNPAAEGGTVTDAVKVVIDGAPPDAVAERMAQPASEAAEFDWRQEVSEHQTPTCSHPPGSG